MYFLVAQPVKVAYKSDASALSDLLLKAPFNWVPGSRPAPFVVISQPGPGQQVSFSEARRKEGLNAFIHLARPPPLQSPRQKTLDFQNVPFIRVELLRKSESLNYFLKLCLNSEIYYLSNLFH